MEQEGPEQAGRENRALAVDGPARERESADQEADANQDPPDWCAALMDVQVLMVIVGTLTLVFIAVQAFETRKSAAAASKLAQLAVDEQRAWVGVSEIAADPLKVGRRISCRAFVANSGKTPAKNVRGWIRIRDHDPEGAVPFVYMGQGDAPLQSAYVLAPQPSAYRPSILVMSDAPLTLPVLDRFNAGRLVVYIYGRIEYDDVFGRPHWTQFGAIMRKRGIVAAPEHNDCD